MRYLMAVVVHVASSVAMAMPYSRLLPLLLFLLHLSVASHAADLRLFHSADRHSPSPLDSALALARAADASRLAFLSSKRTSVPIASGQQALQSSAYVLRAKLGSPPQQLLLAVDTGADVAWAPCSPCASCPAAASQFLPANSSTYTPLSCSSSWCPQFKGQSCADAAPSGPCAFTQSYGGDSSFSALLVQDSLSLDSDVLPNFLFGCVNSVDGAAANLPKQGLLGLGRGTMSLLSQSGNLYQGVFSYCLPSFKSYYFSGSLRLGPVGQPKNARFTPLLKNPHRPSLYYVNLVGVKVGRVLVAVQPDSFAFDPATGAGTVVDSGTVITRFVATAYAAIRDEFRRQANASSGYTSLGAFDTCFSTDEVAVAPSVTLRLEGLDLTLPVENTLIHSSATPLACLAMASAPANVNSVVNVIASLQQQNLRVVVDTANDRLGFARELCN
ncbi:aspartyl protease 25-like [Zingiber officinale]|uniref:aspartyl protease 25-like n=1 Tax=Zingiber officinale TaxID=94328 RepID=UPI001C4BE0DE|nr:aspartyl protease 25-like [Zingiber officinale]